MKIAQITYSGFGGLGSVVFSLITADRSRDHKWLVGFIGDQPLDASYPFRCQENGVGYAAFQSIAGRPYRAWAELAAWLNKVGPDVVICHTINSILACRWYAWRRSAKLVAVEHTSSQAKTRNEWLASRLCMLLADRVVVLTEEVRQELRNAHGRVYRDNKVAVIPNGIDTEVFYPKRPVLESRIPKLRIGMAARFSYHRRQDLLVGVLKRLAQLRPGLAIELVLAGDGSELEKVKSMAASSKSPIRIRFDGLLSEKAVAPWLRELDIYVHATEAENLSTSLLQAMATELPIIASDIPGVANLIGHCGEFGVCVPNTVEAFVEALSALIDAPSDRRDLGERARERVMEHYNQSEMLKSYLALVGN